ncbi:hypothetical protein M422DRAFT_247846 [Sphaerobolus stellatus SS14]|nr:hypothetical protein M422DRAFT_247846 [Sphaerobolus stellatus SS14]
MEKGLAALKLQAEHLGLASNKQENDIAHPSTWYESSKQLYMTRKSPQSRLRPDGEPPESMWDGRGDVYRLSTCDYEMIGENASLTIHGENASSESCSDESDVDSEGVQTEDGQTSDGELPELMWDGHHNVLRCSACDYEVFECQCIWCSLKHKYDEDEDALEYDRSVHTDTTQLRSARLLAPRGMTPIRATYEDDRPPSSFKGT